MAGTMRLFFLSFRLLLIGLSASLLIGLMPASPAYAQGPVVNTALDNESDTCAVNNCTLREAIADAAAGDTITFNSALSGQIITLTGGELILDKTLTISGLGANSLAISGNKAGRVFNINSSGVITITNLTIQDGAASNSNGGGILNAGQLLLTSVVLTNNTVITGRGGGLYVDGGGQATLIGGQVVSNTADSSGGGLGIGTGTITLSGSQVLSNTVPNGSGGGAFVWTSSSRLLASNSLFQGNQAWKGGGLFVESGTAILTDTQITGNSAGYGAGIRTNQPTARLYTTNVMVQKNPASFNGGGLQVHQGVAILTGTQITGNSAVNGGGVFANLGTAILTGTQIFSNVASQYGGGMYNYQGPTTLTNTQILSNSASYGGGLYANQSTAVFTITNVTLERNTASTNGGGLYIFEGRATLTGTQITGNSADYGGGLYGHLLTATFTLANATVENNTAIYSGGGGFLASGTAVLTDTQILSNSAQTGSGGGFFLQNTSAVITATNNQVRGNTANLDGGGLYVNNGRATLTATHLLDNRADRGGGIFSIYGYAQITDSCIVNNSDTSVDLYNTTKPATNNWWGDVNGPAGAGAGNGDSVSSWVDYSSFKTTAPAGCPNRLLPNADAGAAQLVHTGVTVTLDGTLSGDSVGDGLSYFWQQTGGITVTLSASTAVSLTFTTPLTPSVLTFTLTITDALHRADTAATTVTVEAYRVYLPLILR